MASYTLVVNNRDYSVEADPDTPVLWILRDFLHLKGTKYGCGIGQCGACTIHFNGAATRACSLPVSSAVKGRILTIEGLSSDGTHVLQKAWMESDVAQCGYCQAGQIMSAAALLSRNPVPTDAEVDAAMSGNICRCGTYSRIRQAIKLARK